MMKNLKPIKEKTREEKILARVKYEEQATKQ